VSLAALVAIARLELAASPKVVLTWLAFHACENCGLCWPGMKLLQLETGLGETAVRQGLDRLVAAELVEIHGYPQGGRGRATEYVVRPGLPEFSTAPCGKCRENQRKPTPRAGFDNDETAKAHASRGVSAKAHASGPQNPTPGVDQSSIEQNHHARAREAEPSPAAPAPVSSHPPPGTPEARSAVQGILSGIEAHTRAKP